jgi:hypothetical protein
VTVVSRASVVNECPGCRALKERLDSLEQRVAVWLRGHGSRDAQDAALLVLLAAAAGVHHFTAAAAWQRRRYDARLAAALEAADIASARDLAIWLRRMRGVETGGWIVLRGPRCRAGWRWCISRTSSTHAEGLS